MFGCERGNAGGADRRQCAGFERADRRETLTREEYVTSLHQRSAFNSLLRDGYYFYPEIIRTDSRHDKKISAIDLDPLARNHRRRISECMFERADDTLGRDSG